MPYTPAKHIARLEADNAALAADAKKLGASDATILYLNALRSFELCRWRWAYPGI
jgi:hypothetical protein